MLAINLVFFASSAGYYWLETVDHYATGVNLVVFLFLQLIVMVYFLPLSELERKVNKFGEKFPKLYDIPLRFICPGFALFLAVMAVSNELKYPSTTENFFDKALSYTIMATPSVL